MLLTQQKSIGAKKVLDSRSARTLVVQTFPFSPYATPSFGGVMITLVNITKHYTTPFNKSIMFLAVNPA